MASGTLAIQIEFSRRMNLMVSINKCNPLFSIFKVSATTRNYRPELN